MYLFIPTTLFSTNKSFDKKKCHPQKFLTWINWRLSQIISSNQLSINMKHYLCTKIFVVCSDLIGRDAKNRNTIVRTKYHNFCSVYRKLTLTAGFDDGVAFITPLWYNIEFFCITSNNWWRRWSDSKSYVVPIN